jgi:hypothetical protein
VQGSVGWVEQGETQHTQQSFFYPLDDACVGSVAPLENRGSVTIAIGKILTGSLQIFDLTTIDVNKMLS